MAIEPNPKAKEVQRSHSQQMACHEKTDDPGARKRAIRPLLQYSVYLLERLRVLVPHKFGGTKRFEEIHSSRQRLIRSSP